VNWFRHCGLGFHAGEWLALAIVILLSFGSSITSLRLGMWLLTRKRDSYGSEDERDKQYWRAHGE
jgi:hypothetical protein